jgi:head-tail adaptor
MEKMPYIGQMCRMIQVIEEIKTRNSTGEEEVSDAMIAQPFAHLKEMSGSEDVEGKVRHSINRSYTIRYNAAVKVKANQLVVLDGADRFDVYHVKEIGRKRFLEIMVHQNE